MLVPFATDQVLLQLGPTPRDLDRQVQGNPREQPDRVGGEVSHGQAADDPPREGRRGVARREEDRPDRVAGRG